MQLGTLVYTQCFELQLQLHLYSCAAVGCEVEPLAIMSALLDCIFNRPELCWTFLARVDAQV